MKKMLTMLLISAVGISMFPFTSTAEAANKPIVGNPELSVLVDGRKVVFQGGDPVSEKGRVQVPLRGIGEALDANVGYSGNTVTYQKTGKSITLTLGSNVAIVDGESVSMDTTAKAVKGRTYVPLRFVSENLGVSVSWDQAANWVWIGSKEIPTPEEAGVKNVPISDFKKLIGNHKWLLSNALGVEYTTVNVIKVNQLPLKIGDRVVYDIWPVKQGKFEGLKMRASNGDPTLVYLGSKIDARKRNSLEYLLEKNDKTRTLTYPVVIGHDIDFDKNYKNLKLAQIDYFAVYMDSDAMTVIENPFK